MSKPARTAEPALLGTALTAAGVPVIAQLTGAARADGGDFIWLDEQTMLAGRSYRTNAEGLRQLTRILAAEGATLESVDLPHDRGPGHVLHLMSLISPVADDLAVVYPPLAPVALMQTLAERGIRVIPVDGDEYETMGCNVLAIAPRHVLMVNGNPKTRAALESAGCQVHGYDGSEISLKGDGGPTCLTAPIWRTAEASDANQPPGTHPLAPGQGAAPGYRAGGAFPGGGRCAPRRTGRMVTSASSSERTRSATTASPSMAPQLNRSMAIRSSSGQV